MVNKGGDCENIEKTDWRELKGKIERMWQFNVKGQNAKADTGCEEEESFKFKTRRMVVPFAEIGNQREKASFQSKLSSFLAILSLSLLWERDMS